MISFGAVGGAPINTFPIDSGTFRVELGGSLPVAIGAAARATLRHSVGGATGVTTGFVAELIGVLNARTGSADVPIGANAVAVRRKVMLGSAATSVFAAATVNRRRENRGDAAIAIGAEGNLGWHFLHLAACERRATMPLARRDAEIASETRMSVLAPDQRGLVVPPAARNAA